jgi:putative PIN family toxin of toxin-antitoxin system
MQSLFTNPVIKIYVCNELLDEFVNVSSRLKIHKYITDTDLQDVYQWMERYCCYVPISKKAVSSIRDEKDLYLLSLAETIPADFILTGDKDLLTLQYHRQTKIVTYRQFKDYLNSIN